MMHPVRQLVKDQLTAALEAGTPGRFKVDPYARNATINQPTVMVRFDNWVPAPDLPPSMRRYVFALLVITPKTSPGPADDELDGDMEDVCAAVLDTTHMDVTGAERVTYTAEPDKGPALPAWQITAHVDTDVARSNP